MKIILIGLFISILAVQGYKENCRDTMEIEPNCGNYCFKAVKPVLDYTKFIQTQMEDLKNKPEYLDKLEKSEQQIRVKIDEQDKKLEKSERKIESRLELQDKNIEQKLEDLRRLIESKNDRRPFRKIGSKYYYIEQLENLNWFEALHKCLTLGGHLVSIKNLSEFNAIIATLQPHKHYWIDLNDLGTEGVFLSVATGLQPTYVNWHPPGPDNYRNLEHCGELWWHNNKHLMNDNQCNTKKFFICEPYNQ
ncbi:accessory gland protein Acp29AB-like [Drosophila innubila]|uniref:accessory gland protein Acp29AB-like n=1 Tax=Drosophila innubila TaxID=198719 RepID=UPI00148C51E5|nr:accessory gland protein Acp29AB-like [Drosophila innubila]